MKYFKIAMSWPNDPILKEDYIYEFNYLEDLNERRIRDAELIGSVCCNTRPRKILEIGTGTGRTTALMAINAPEAEIFTVNIHPGEINSGGKNITFAPSIEEIGSYYKQLNLHNVHQII
ncbi:MAG: hypothetical protein RRA35_06510, partial [Desulfomonilia bacterium]|nr:hypothetical protein [Desulfomonilia bacterium]